MTNDSNNLRDMPAGSCTGLKIRLLRSNIGSFIIPHSDSKNIPGSGWYLSGGKRELGSLCHHYQPFVNFLELSEKKPLLFLASFAAHSGKSVLRRSEIWDLSIQEHAVPFLHHISSVPYSHMKDSHFQILHIDITVARFGFQITTPPNHVSFLLSLSSFKYLVYQQHSVINSSHAILEKCHWNLRGRLQRLPCRMEESRQTKGWAHVFSSFSAHCSSEAPIEHTSKTFSDDIVRLTVDQFVALTGSTQKPSWDRELTIFPCPVLQIEQFEQQEDRGDIWADRGNIQIPKTKVERGCVVSWVAETPERGGLILEVAMATPCSTCLEATVLNSLWYFKTFFDRES